MSGKEIKLNRRNFLFASAMSVAGIVLSACAQPTPTPTPAPKAAAPAAPTAAPKPVATTAPAAAPTAAPTRPPNTPVATAAPATAVPAATASKEAPALAELVKAGKLPALADRLPKNPLTLACLDAVGDYGGRIRTMTSNLGNGMSEWMYGHSPLRWVDDGLGIAPGMCESYETNKDNTEWTVVFRKGLKWSNGDPCTVDDVIFWWQDLVVNPDQADVPPDFGQAGGKLAEFIKVDDFTLKIKYAVSAPLTAKRLAMWTNSDNGPRWIAPSKYLKQFHPVYNKDVKDFSVFDQKILYRQNPECPTLTSWMCSKFEPGKSRTYERNPYYYCVDQQGKQLPYIDGIDEIMVADVEVQKLTIMQGNIDYAAHVNFNQDLANIAVLKENETKGGYELRLLDGGGGSGIYYFHNFDTPDPKKRALYRNPKFKAAMAYCMDRASIQKTLFYNTGELTSGIMSPKAIEFNFNDEARAMYKKWRDSYIQFDIPKAKALLDEIGCKDVNNDGFREMPDGSKLEVRFDYQADMSKTNLDGYEMCKKNWTAAGIATVVNPIPPNDFNVFWQSGKGEVRANWGVGDGPDCLVYPSWMVPNEPARWAPLCGNLFVMLGTPKQDTEKEKSPWDRQPPRFASDEPDFKNTVVPKLQDLLIKALAEPDAMKRMQYVWDMINIHVEQGNFGMGSVANTPNQYVVSKKLINVPKKEQLKLGGFCGPWIVPHPALHNPETFAYKKA